MNFLFEVDGLPDTYNWSKYNNEPAEYSDINNIFISSHLHPPKALKSFWKKMFKDSESQRQ